MAGIMGTASIACLLGKTVEQITVSHACRELL